LIRQRLQHRSYPSRLATVLWGACRESEGAPPLWFRDGRVCYYRGTEDTAQTQEMLMPA